MSSGPSNGSAPPGIPEVMQAVLLTGHGGFDRLEIRDDVPVPAPAPGEVLMRVGGAGVNNTDVNTRIGWYSKAVTSATGEGSDGFDEVDTAEADAAWGANPLHFPRIQGADCCGRIVAVGSGVDPDRIGERVLVRTMQNAVAGQATPAESEVFGSEMDGGFAQFAVARSKDALRVDCGWTDIELASIPCAYSTAEGMLHRAGVVAGERVLITGASGGVGSAAVQLATRRGAEVVAVCGTGKAGAVAELGAGTVLDRTADLLAGLGTNAVDVVVDLVAGPSWPQLLEVLRVGGRYVVAGAIAGPIVALDVRTLYLKDLTLLGCTFQPDEVMIDLISYIERGEIQPVIAATYPLDRIVAAQERFLNKDFVGKLVLVPAGAGEDR